MKIFYSIVFFVALIIIITLGLKRSNAFFRDTRNLGELNYLTPPASTKQTEVVDTTANRAEKAMEGEKTTEGKKE